MPRVSQKLVLQVRASNANCHVTLKDVDSELEVKDSNASGANMFLALCMAMTNDYPVDVRIRSGLITEVTFLHAHV